MPEVVQLYAESRDILVLESTYETLLQGYRDDVEKYAQGKRLPEVIRFILKEGWHKAGQAVTLGGFAGSSYNAREVGEAFRLLEKAMLLELVYPTTATEVPATPEIKRMPKLVWLDTGLVNYAAQVQKEVLGAKDIMVLPGQDAVGPALHDKGQPIQAAAAAEEYFGSVPLAPLLLQTAVDACAL